jgi:hypothetical protein
MVVQSVVMAKRPEKLQRKRAVSVSEIREASVRLSRLSASLSAIAERAESGGLSELVFDGANASERGIHLLKVFTSGATRALELEEI